MSYSEKEIEIRSKLLQCVCRETNEQQQQILKDHADIVYECTGKSKSLQSLTQKYNHFAFHLNKEAKVTRETFKLISRLKLTTP